MRFLPCLLLVVLIAAGCGKNRGKASQDSKEYQTAVSDFYIALAAGQTDNVLFAYNKMFEITKSYPDEPAIWADLGVFAMRQGNYDLSQKWLSRAADLAPENGKIRFLTGLLKSRQGKIGDAITELRKAAKQAPKDPYILSSLVKELERQNKEGNAGEIDSLLDDLKKIYPDNLAVTFSRLRLFAKEKDGTSFQKGLKQIRQHRSDWPDQIRKELDKIQDLAAKKDFQEITIELAFLENLLQQQPRYQRDVGRIRLPSNQVGFMITRFINLPDPSPSAAPVDPNLSFDRETIPGTLPPTGMRIRTFSFAGERIPAVLLLNDGKAFFNDGKKLKFPGSDSGGFHETAAIDYNYDFRNDLAFAGAGGFRLYQQQPDSSFKDVTSSLNLPESVLKTSYRGVWTADPDLDGDLDLVLSPDKGPAILLRNNGDNTFSKRPLFAKIDNIVDFQWGDLDNDGDADAAILDRSGKLAIYRNRRLGHFRQVSPDQLPDSVAGFTIADLNSDGQFDIILIKNKGNLEQLTFDPATQSWKGKQLSHWSGFSGGKRTAVARVFVQDFDNNGRLDVLASGADAAHLWLSNPDGTLKSVQKDFPVSVYSVADMAGNGRLDWIGLSDGKPEIWTNNGSDNYKGEVIRPRASGPLGDRRINSFGIGGILEARAGLIYQRQLITSPMVHFGVGDKSRADMLRIIWPNGSVQAEFAELGYSNAITNQQSLKGSCPWLFAWNGRKMDFVADFLWRSPLGLRINAQKTAPILKGQTEDWVKISGDQLKPKNGYYDVRITAELWETHYFDYIALMSVDHPKNTRVFVDERFAFPPPELKVYTTGLLHPVRHVWDDQGREVTDIVAEKDGRYLDHFKDTKYQGIARKHYIEIDLGDHLPGKGPVWLILYGWVYPTDSSINVAIGQGSNKPPVGISVEVPDGHGGWKTAETNVGFPEGKNKTILIGLQGLFKKEGDHRLRLTTTTETYWDQIAWARGLPSVSLKKKRLLPDSAELRYRGYSKMIRTTRSSPEVPDYQVIAGTSPKWQDLTGFYTRYGDVKPLLRKVDDRYVIMNAGDEMRFLFKAPPPPPDGWVRDFVMIGDGWEKDGDYNTTFSKTVIPLPTHAHSDYTTRPTTLQEDPVYKKHKSDWIHYHTRYITPKPFYRALVTKKQVGE